MKRFIAAMSFFTVVPFWKLTHLEKKHYLNLVTFWPIAGWFTGTVMALTFAIAALFLPVNVAVILAILARLLLTGALHEDGFADFFDGFGGGKDRQSILKIMKDSHIGTYGVVALVIYFLLLFNVINSYMLIRQVELTQGCFAVSCPSFCNYFKMALIFIAADPFAKWTSSNVINILPYARLEEQAKNKLLYAKMTFFEKIFALICGAIPTLILMPIKFVIPMFITSLVTMIIIYIFYKKIKGYTGDCCGASFIISELTFYISALIITSL